MDKGKNKWNTPWHASIGGIWVAPENPKPQTNSYEMSSRYNNVDKTSGNYARYTVKEKTTYNERHVERGSRREGVRDEYKVSKTVKVGNKNGYTEYHTEKRVREVEFDNSSKSYQGGGKRYLTGGKYGSGNDYSYSGGGGGSYSYDSDDDDYY